MTRRRLSCLLVLLATAAIPGTAPLRAQDWTDGQLVDSTKGFEKDLLPERLQQVADLLQHLPVAMTAIVARIHGDHREYLLKIDRLIGELSNPRWSVREEAERTLIEVGARAQAILEQHGKNGSCLEEQMRCLRILDAIRARGTAEEERQTKILRGLVTTALYLPDPVEPRLRQALRSALGHTDPQVVETAIRALGAHGGDDDADAVFQMLEWKNGTYRQTALLALAEMPCARALARCQELVDGGKLSRGETCALMRAARARTDAQALIQSLQSSSDPIVAAGARLPKAPAGASSPVQLILADSARTVIKGEFGGFLGDTSAIGGAIPGLPRIRIPFTDGEALDFPTHTAAPTHETRVFLTQGSLVTGTLQSIDLETVRLVSPVFGPLTLRRSDTQGIAIDPELDRLVGASIDHDRVRLRTNEFLDGSIRGVADGVVDVVLLNGEERKLPLAEVAGLLTIRPKAIESDNTVYVRLDLTNGDRILGFVVGSTGSHFAVSAPLLGAALVPVDQVLHVEVGVGGGAMWGFTLIADYSDNKVVEVDEQGRIQFELDDVFGAWDAKCLDNGNLLVTEFSVSRVREIERKTKKTVWTFDKLKNPYAAERLPNGNTLIADTFGSRVIEVTPAKEIVWKFDKEIRPFDAERLANGNTLIADVLKDRVIEVNPQGEITWQVTGMNNVHDADRLPNGNTMITLRSRGAVIEVDRDGKVVWELTGLSSPSDAARLPNGHTLVAENGQVREFDRHKNVVWRKEMTWAVEVNRY